MAINKRFKKKGTMYTNPALTDQKESAFERAIAEKHIHKGENYAAY